MTTPHPETALDLLTEPLFSVRLPGEGISHLSLAGVLTTLATRDIASFSALRAHQWPAWHSFLVQIAAIALGSSGSTGTEMLESDWIEALRAVSGGPSAWCLIVEDILQPAFLQPPVTEGSLAAFEKTLANPDSLDVLVTTKNHDIKRSRIRGDSPEHWVYALVSLQTTGGYSGKFNYGVARMNGGYGSRPSVGFTPSLSWGDRFRRDLAVARTERLSLTHEHYDYAMSNGAALLWVAPWDGNNALSMSDLDPLFVEICRRIRLSPLGNGSIVARTAPSQSARLAIESSKGDTGDPWTPIRVEDAASLSVSEAGFSFDLTQRLLLAGDYRNGAAGKLQATDEPVLWFVTAALSRGQGQTNGFHERWVSLPARIRTRLGRTSERDRLAALARKRVERAATVASKVLRPALQKLLQADPAKVDFKDERPSRWLLKLNRAINSTFFDQLWADAESNEAEADASWDTALYSISRAQLEAAIESAPLPAARRYRAIVAAERTFSGAWHQHFGEVPHKSSHND